MNENVTILKDVNVNSKYKNNNLDIIYPNNLQKNEEKPVLIWAHGGAFVAGDKKDTQDYLVLLANQGYIIVNINYVLAPNQKYPYKSNQIGEAYTFINDNLDYTYMDKDQIIFGGDSAGAHMIGQYLLTERANKDSNLVNIKPYNT